VKCKQCTKIIKDDQEYIRIKLSNVHRECLDDFIKEHVKKGRKERKKRQREMKTFKQESKARKNLTYTQEVFNRYIRWRDTRPEDKGACISCGKVVEYGSRTCHAGHFYSRGARSDLRFNPDNVHAQCQNCNNYGTAETLANYKDNLIKKIGKKRFEALKERKQQDYTMKTLKQIRKEFKQLMKE
jgi:hypothetical protein